MTIQNLKSIFGVVAAERDYQEMEKVSHYLKFKVSYFRGFRIQTLIKICERLIFTEFNKDQVLMHEGEIGDSVQILL